MNPKTQILISLIGELYEHIVSNPLLSKKVKDKNQIQAELLPIIFEYMQNNFKIRIRKTQ